MLSAFSAASGSDSFSSDFSVSLSFCSSPSGFSGASPSGFSMPGASFLVPTVNVMVSPSTLFTSPYTASSSATSSFASVSDVFSESVSAASVELSVAVFVVSDAYTPMVPPAISDTLSISPIIDFTYLFFIIVCFLSLILETTIIPKYVHSVFTS